MNCNITMVQRIKSDILMQKRKLELNKLSMGFKKETSGENNFSVPKWQP